MIYNVWQVEEILKFLLKLQLLIHKKNAQIRFVGLDFKNKEEKMGLNSIDMVNTRERLMAENLKNDYDNERVSFVWAHNTHVGKYGFNKSEKTYVPSKTTGHYLDNFFGERYVAVAQAFLVGDFLARKKVNGKLTNWEVFHVDVPDNVQMLENVFSKLVDKGNYSIFHSNNLPSRVKYIRNLGYYFMPEQESNFKVPIYIDTYDFFVVHSSSESTTRLDI